MADMKGDLSGISQAGKLNGFIEKLITEFGLENPQFQACPVRFFEVYGEQGHASKYGTPQDNRVEFYYINY